MLLTIEKVDGGRFWLNSPEIGLVVSLAAWRKLYDAMVQARLELNGNEQGIVDIPDFFVLSQIAPSSLDGQ